MQAACVGCKRVLSDADQIECPISRDLCVNCALDLQFESEPLRAFLDKLPGAVMAVNAEGRVLVANSAAAALVQKDLPAVEGHFGGEVLSCVYADLPEGCGKTIHCSGCTIRKAVERTRATGEAHLESPAYAYVRGPRGAVRMWFLISTQRIGDVVLLRIDAGEPEDQDEESVERWLPIARALRSGPDRPPS